MFLQEYIDNQGFRLDRFCERVGIAPKTLYAILKKPSAKITLETAIKIEKATNGAVTCHDLYNATKSSCDAS